MNVNDIVVYGQATQLGNEWLEVIKEQALYNPFEGNVVKVKEQKASIRFGDLSDSDLLKGIGYLFIEQGLENL